MARKKKYYISSVNWNLKTLAILQDIGYMDHKGKVRKGMKISNLMNQLIQKEFCNRTTPQINKKILLSRILDIQYQRDKLQEDLKYFADKLKVVNNQINQRKIKDFKK